MAAAAAASPGAPAAPAPPAPAPLPYAALRAAAAGWHPLAVVGEGGFGKVYRGVLSLSDGSVLPVAIKRQAPLGPAGAGGAGATGGATGGGGGGQQANPHRQGGAEFANEVALLRRLQHPNLVRLVGWCDPTADGGGASRNSNPFSKSAAGGGGGGGGGGGSALESRGGERCLVYELCAGGSLDDALRQHHASPHPSAPSLGWRARLAVAAQAAAAVAALHACAPRPVVHGDVKPANILLLLPDAARAGAGGGAGSGGGAAGGVTAKLADVGLASELGAPAARAAATTTTTTTATATTGGGGAGPRPAEGSGGEVRGDWAYLPPEARSHGRVGPPSDAYALGVTLLQLATGSADRVHELPLRARLAAAGAGGEGAGEGGEGGLAGLLDPRAGAWDRGAGERLLRVGLWLCADEPGARPTAAAAAGLLARLHAAAERAAERAGARERARAEQLAEAWAVL